MITQEEFINLKIGDEILDRGDVSPKLYKVTSHTRSIPDTFKGEYITVENGPVKIYIFRARLSSIVYNSLEVVSKESDKYFKETCKAIDMIKHNLIKFDEVYGLGNHGNLGNRVEVSKASLEIVKVLIKLKEGLK